MKIYPTSGDEGCSNLPDGRSASKDDVHFEATGTLDELNSVVGRTACACSGHNALKVKLERLQRELFNLGARVGGWHKVPDMAEATALLEREMAEWTARFDLTKGFVLPGGSELSSRLDMARTVCRRAERCVARLGRQRAPQVQPDAHRYLNRLSDWLFVAARWVNRGTGIDKDRTVGPYQENEGPT